MPVIALTTPLFTDTSRIVEALQVLWNCHVYGDDDIIAQTARDHQISPELLTRVVQADPIAYNNFTHEKEKAQAALGKTLADLTAKGNCIFSGITCHLIPNWVTHVFRALALAGTVSRIKTACDLKSFSDPTAGQAIKEADQKADQWVRQIQNTSIWDQALYDLVLDLTDKEEETVAQLQKAASLPPFTGKAPRAKEVADLSVAAPVQLALARLGGGLKVSADNGHIIVTIEKRRMNLPQTQSEIMTSAKQVPGVISVKTRIGATYYKSEMIKDFDFGPSTRGS